MSKSQHMLMLQNALALHSKGDIKEAEKIYNMILNQDSKNYFAAHYLGIIKSSTGDITSAKKLMKLSLKINPPNLEFIENYATLLLQNQEWDEAIDQCQKGLRLSKNKHSLLYIYANALFSKGKCEDAISKFDLILSENSGHIGALNDKAATLAKLKRYEEALTLIKQALAINPRYVDALINYGNILYNSDELTQAIEMFNRAIQIDNKNAKAYLGLGNIFTKSKDYNKAIDILNIALSLNNKLPEAWYTRGFALSEIGDYDNALTCFNQAIELNFASAELYIDRGNVHLDKKDLQAAFNDYKLAFKYNPSLPYILGSLLKVKLNLCEWSSLKKDIYDIEEAVKKNKNLCLPFIFLAVSDNPMDILKCSQSHADAKFKVKLANNLPQKINHDRIRIGYLSADIRNHPIAQLTAELFELHNRDQFLIYCFSLGPDDKSDIRHRIEQSFDHFINCNQMSTENIIKKIRECEIDILVDVNGYTEFARTEVLMRRPAPIQVNYLGFPATMGATFIDFIIGDYTLMRDHEEHYYSEKLVRLPDCYQPNDRKRLISDSKFRRNDLHLPDHSFVYCCFNNIYKIMPEQFNLWLNILREVEDSVLWLLASHPQARNNLKSLAQKNNIDPQRIIFADHMKHGDHLARLSHADLFLDTLPYNAHTTASDALWAGLPLLTQMGQSFHSRVAASLLNAMGAPELIVETAEDYKNLAITLANDQGKYAAIRRKIAQNKMSAPLFNTPLYVQNIENAYLNMIEQYNSGTEFTHINL
jgi:protein O-GlcNAc transferase